MSYHVDSECIQLSDEDNLVGAWMDIGVVDKSLSVDITGPTYTDADNYPRSEFFNIRLNTDDAIALWQFLDGAIERMRNSVE